MRRAVIDIGTNTVKLLVADVQDGQVTPVISMDRTTRLGEGVNASGRLLPAASARTIEAAGQFVSEARTLEAEDIAAFTTSAVRDATNGSEFLDDVRRKCGIDVKLISGEQEAAFIFRGVASDPAWADTSLLVMDVGGGSSEFIRGRRGVIERCQSLPLGAVRLTERFGEDQFGELAEHLRRELHPALAEYRTGDWKMIGTGGTIKTLARILRGEMDHALLSLDDVRALVARLNGMTLDERRRVPGLPPERADIIVAGGAVFLFAMEALNVFELTVSERSLRYGALLSA